MVDVIDLARVVLVHEIHVECSEEVQKARPVEGATLVAIYVKDLGETLRRNDRSLVAIRSMVQEIVFKSHSQAKVELPKIHS